MKIWASLPFSLLICLMAYSTPSTQEVPNYTAKIFSSSSEDKTPSTDNKKIIEDFYQAFQANDQKQLGNSLSTSYGVISASELQETSYSKYSEMSKNIKVRASAMKKAMPEFSVRIEELLSEGSKVTARVTISGIQKGDFFGVAPTNKPVVIKMFTIFTITGGKITSINEIWNEYSVMKQIGYFVI